MSIQTYSEGLTEVNFLVMEVGNTSITVSAGTGSKTTTIPHSLKKAPFIEYQLSFDNGVTYISPDRGFSANTTTDPNLHFVSAYADSTNAYFVFGSQSTPIALDIKIKYVLLLAEGS